MKGSKLIELIQSAIDEDGDHDIVFAHEGWGYDPHEHVDFSNVKAGVIDEDKTPNCFVIGIDP